MGGREAVSAGVVSPLTAPADCRAVTRSGAVRILRLCPGLGHGKICTMSIPTVAEALAPFGDAELIPLPDLGRAVGLDAAKQTYAVRKGIIVPASNGPGAAGRGPNGRYMITRDEAMLILAAAALAAVIGVALVTVIRTLRNSGATVTPAGVLLPLDGLK